MHHSYDDILATATEPNEYGTRTAVLHLAPGDTAYAPGTTKYHLLGHGNGGSVTYTFFREGVEGVVEGQVARSLIA
jgi:hypothetical protein